MKFSGRESAQLSEQPPTHTHNLVVSHHGPGPHGCSAPPCRLVGDEERRWTDENIDMVALKHFPNIDKERATSRPILYSNWLSKVTTGSTSLRPFS